MDQDRMDFAVYWSVYPILKKYESDGFDPDSAAKKIASRVRRECSAWLLVQSKPETRNGHHPECKEVDCPGECGEAFGK